MELARYFGSYVKLHVHCMYQGAQFGMANWLNFYKIFPIVSVVLAKKTRKPVQLLYDDSYWQHRGYEQGVYYMKVGFNDDGTIIACQNDSIPQSPSSMPRWSRVRLLNTTRAPTSYLTSTGQPACATVTVCVPAVCGT
jgi:hypothetical protein